MCGLAGVISFDSEKCCPEVLKEMSRVLAHRGPDDESFYQDEFLSFTFRRLSIIDVESGQQPIWNEDDDIFIAVNGEIYNHVELRNKLKQEHTFKTNSDAEIVLHLYEEYGTDAIALLNGMFAIIIWDKRSNLLLLARDRLGIKPLYYTISDEKLIFASELKSLLMHPECSRELEWGDLDILNLQQQNNISTYVENVHYLSAGTYAIFDQKNGFTKSKYWEIDTAIKSPSRKTAIEIMADYQSLLEDSVQKRLMSDVPLGVFLSGGIDSSLITALASRTHSQLHCFTVVERTTYRAGDVQQARDVAKQLNIPFYPVLFDTNKIADEFDLAGLEEMVCLIESPRFDPEWLFKSELHRAAKHYVPDLKVILLGQGADEFAGGYSNSLGAGNSCWNDYLESISPSLKYYRNKERNIPERLNRLMCSNNSSIKTDCYHEKMKLLVNQMQYFNLWHEDRTSSYHSIESRVPFLDHRIVELLASIPEDMHAELFWDKSIVRNALHNSIDNYPKEKKKIPFFVTDDISSINEFAWKICTNIYEDFRKKYLEDNNCIVDIVLCEELFDDVLRRRHDMYDSAWQLIEIMTIAIFAKYLMNPSVYLDNNTSKIKEPLPLVLDSEWDKLNNDFLAPVYNINAINCTGDDIINIPKHCEILNPLTESEGNTCLILSSKGKQVRRISLDDQCYWLVQVIDEMGRHINAPKTINYWLERSGAETQVFYALVNQLVTGGLLEKVDNIS